VLSGLRRPDQLRLGGRCVFAPTPRGLYWRWKIVPWRWTAREALFEEHLWRSSEAAPGPRGGWARPDHEGTEGAGEATPERLEVLYRQLRASLEVASNEPGASDFYYGEMEMRRRASRNRSERWLLNGYWLASGYGLRASRAVSWLVALILAAAFVLQYAGFQIHGHEHAPGYLYCVLYAAGSVVSLSLANGHLPAVMTALGDVIHLVLRIGGPVLLGLAALAVRGRKMMAWMLRVGATCSSVTTTPSLSQALPSRSTEPSRSVTCALMVMFPLPLWVMCVPGLKQMAPRPSVTRSHRLPSASGSKRQP